MKAVYSCWVASTLFVFDVNPRLPRLPGDAGDLFTRSGPPRGDPRRSERTVTGPPNASARPNLLDNNNNNVSTQTEPNHTEIIQPLRRLLTTNRRQKNLSFKFIPKYHFIARIISGKYITLEIISILWTADTGSYIQLHSRNLLKGVIPDERLAIVFMQIGRTEIEVYIYLQCTVCLQRGFEETGFSSYKTIANIAYSQGGRICLMQPVVQRVCSIFLRSCHSVVTGPRSVCLLRRPRWWSADRRFHTTEEGANEY